MCSKSYYQGIAVRGKPVGNYPCKITYCEKLLLVITIQEYTIGFVTFIGELLGKFTIKETPTCHEPILHFIGSPSRPKSKEIQIIRWDIYNS